MCLITLQKEPLIATEDIICYKTVNIDSGIIKSEYQCFIYELDKLYETKFSIVKNKIYKGFHSYPESEYKRIKNFLNCIKCIIPKNSEYYIGTYDGHDCYCSNKIMVTEIVSDRNKNQYINGKKEGCWKEYYNNGNLYSKGNYKDGILTGYWEEYWNNGNLSSKGNIRSKGTYKDGKQDGYWEWFNEDGCIVVKRNYKNERQE